MGDSGSVTAGSGTAGQGLCRCRSPLIPPKVAFSRRRVHVPGCTFLPRTHPADATLAVTGSVQPLSSAERCHLEFAN